MAQLKRTPSVARPR